MSKRILITGASGGFGQLTVNTLLRQGHTVAASMRNVNGKNRDIANELKEKGAHIVEIDVTKDDSVSSGVQAAIDAMGGLDVVVNNAGVGVLGMQEHFTPEDIRHLFDINVIGVQRVCRAALPHLRKQGSGLLILVSSLLGRMTLPFYGPYNASKWAAEAMAENYRTELSGFGIDSCIVEPGGYPTSFFEALIKPSDNSRDEEYGEFMDAPQGMFDAFEGALANNKEQDPQNVADAIANLVNTPAGERQFRTTVDKLGMGDHLDPYNEHLEKLTHGIYSSFGIDGMLKLEASEA